MEENRLISGEQLAALLQVNPGTIRKWRCTGRGPKPVKFERMVRYRASDVEAWINRFAGGGETTA